MKRILLAASLAATAAAAVADVNGIVLRINDRIATLHDYRQRYAERVQAIRRRDVEPERQAELLAGAGREAFCELFQELLVLSRADQERLEVSEEQVDEAVAGARENLAIETDEQFQRALAQSGLTEAALRDQMRRNILMQQVMGATMRERVQLDEEDLRRYYQGHLEEFQLPRRLHLREVVVLEDAPASAAERTAAAAAIRDAAEGEGGLAAAAAAYRERGLATEVIDLGWVAAGDLDPGLEAAVWELPAGAVSAPVAGRGGLHVVEVVEVAEARVESFDEVRDRIEARERQRLVDREMGRFLRELVASSYIVEQPPPEAIGYRDECLTEAAAEPTLAAPVE